MSRDEQERLRDIDDAILAIRRHLKHAGETAAAKEDPLLHDALLFQFIAIGEAVKHLTPESISTAYSRSCSETFRRLSRPSRVFLANDGRGTPCLG